MLRIEDSQRAEATTDLMHITMHALPLVPLGGDMGRVVEDVLAIQCPLHNPQNDVAMVRGGRKVVVRCLQIQDVAPRRR